jgi:hypothetical protein
MSALWRATIACNRPTAVLRTRATNSLVAVNRTSEATDPIPVYASSQSCGATLPLLDSSRLWRRTYAFPDHLLRQTIGKTLDTYGDVIFGHAFALVDYIGIILASDSRSAFKDCLLPRPSINYTEPCVDTGQQSYANKTVSDDFV